MQWLWWQQQWRPHHPIPSRKLNKPWQPFSEAAGMASVEAEAVEILEGAGDRPPPGRPTQDKATHIKISPLRAEGKGTTTTPHQIHATSTGSLAGLHTTAAQRRLAHGKILLHHLKIDNNERPRLTLSVQF